MGEGRYGVTGDGLDRLNELDSDLRSTAGTGNEAAFSTALTDLLDAARTLGFAMPEEGGALPDLVVPDQETIVRGLRALDDLKGPVPQ
ncbi:PspA-associated protein PspAA [Streptomyces lavendulae]|uniref:PspA-associated protein PspAA n=1 Tax=Streptomyces lavendulae TaxID=1914 RepID=UPI0024A2A668|nr:hypothetical protein [Streptomyces lavendulae]GLW03084.1 hypothetical protein Slala05_67140 [Streptomyces lavendulae subsp. lavendulae]